MSHAWRYAALAFLAAFVVSLCIAIFNADRRPHVLLAGDSISQFYASGVAKKLGEKFRVEIIPENGGDSRNLLAHLDDWVIRARPDVIVLNAGLHDIVFERDDAVSLHEYEKNLTAIVTRIESETSARLIWATTTPVVDEVHLRVKHFVRREADVQRYNDAALKIMKKFNVQVVDLHAVMTAADPAARLSEDGIHPAPLGQGLLADAVVRAVREQ